MPLHDLSHPVRTGMPVYPGDPSVHIAPVLSVETDGVAVARLDFGSHTGTHLDAPSHSIVGGRTVDQIPLDDLAGPACVLQATAEARSTIEIEHFEELPEVLPAVVCIATGWDAHFNSISVVDHPHLSLPCARELWQRGARVLGVDMLSPDPTSGEDAEDAEDAPEPGFPVHDFWLGSDGVIVENLTGLTTLPLHIDIMLLPLRLEGVDGSPVRAVARTS